MKIAKLFELSTGHRLSDYSGKCRHLHGHNYIGELIIEGHFLNKVGMLEDFGTMKEIIKDCIDKKFDHKFILKKDDPFNEAIGKVCKKFKDDSIVWVQYNPTVENIIKDIKNTIEAIYPEWHIHIRINETSSSYAEL